MKKIIILFLIIFLTGSITVSAQEGYVLKAKISMINAVPKQFFGTWSVQSVQVSTDSPKTFSKSSLDLWNLRRSGNVIELRNPVTAAVAEIYLDDVNENEIVFTHYDSKPITCKGAIAQDAITPFFVNHPCQLRTLLFNYNTA